LAQQQLVLVIDSSCSLFSVMAEKRAKKKGILAFLQAVTGVFFRLNAFVSVRLEPKALYLFRFFSSPDFVLVMIYPAQLFTHLKQQKEGRQR
jgi:hypothetical protein